MDQLNVAVLEYRLEAFEEKQLITGLDCAIFIQEYFPSCKIVMITAKNTSILLYNLYAKKRLHALIVKSDFMPSVFKELIETNLLNPIYYSNQVKMAVKQMYQLPILLDPKNSVILLYLDAGFRVVQIQDYLNLSRSTIQRRIGKMLVHFQVKDHQELVEKARKLKLL